MLLRVARQRCDVRGGRANRCNTCACPPAEPAFATVFRLPGRRGAKGAAACAPPPPPPPNRSMQEVRRDMCLAHTRERARAPPRAVRPISSPSAKHEVYVQIRRVAEFCLLQRGDGRQARPPSWCFGAATSRAWPAASTPSGPARLPARHARPATRAKSAVCSGADRPLVFGTGNPCQPLPYSVGRLLRSSLGPGHGPVDLTGCRLI